LLINKSNLWIARGITGIFLRGASGCKTLTQLGLMSTLINRNITLKGRRTSLRLEPDMWEALFEICVRENCPIGELCTQIDEAKEDSSLTAAIRVYILIYFRNAAASDQPRSVETFLGEAI
jgi:predicted DNA-binding ribbon-helix-helix protein